MNIYVLDSHITVQIQEFVSKNFPEHEICSAPGNADIAFISGRMIYENRVTLPTCKVVAMSTEPYFLNQVKDMVDATFDKNNFLSFNMQKKGAIEDLITNFERVFALV